MALKNVELTTSPRDTVPHAEPSSARAISDVAPRTPSHASSDVAPRQRNIVDTERLSYHLLRPQQSGPADLPLLGLAYRCWSEIWTQTLAELDGITRLPSDDFTRQDEIGALFHGWDCIGMTFFRWIDLANPIFKDDSYFTPWSPEALAKATSQGTRICISSHFTVHSQWRNAKGCSIKDVLGALIVERFLRSDCHALVGTMRNDHGMNRFTYRFGAKPVERNAVHHGVPVDLIAFYRGLCVRPRLADDVESVVERVCAGWQ
jgi:hypothetical protein